MVVSFLRKAGRLLDRRDWAAVALVLGVKALLLLYAVGAYETMTNVPVVSWTRALGLLHRWDAVHYAHLAEHGYADQGEHAVLLVFFPFFPLLIRFVHFFGTSYAHSALLVSGVASLSAGVLLRRLALLDAEADVAFRSVVLLFLFPTSYFLHLGYTEGLFLTLVCGAFLAARAGRWGWVATLGFLAGLTRVNAFVLVPALACEVFAARRAGRVGRSLLALGATLAGFVGYFGLNLYLHDNPLAFLDYQKTHWHRSFAWPWQGIAELVGVWNHTNAWDAHMMGLQELIFVLLGLAAIVAASRTLRASYVAWMGGNWLLYTCQGFVQSAPRYTLLLFPLFFIMARVSSRPLVYGLFTLWSVLFLGLFSAQFVKGGWAF
jgi:hypothetical protein